MIKSESFQQSYCIFISTTTANSFAKKVREYKDSAVQVLKGTFEDAPAVIVIPSDRPYMRIEKELFEWCNKQVEEVKKSGFWGQWGMGYLGKEWEVVS